MTFVLIPLMYVIGKNFNPENIAYYGVHPHPFLVLSIFLSSIYGLFYSFLISITLSAFYLILLHFQIDYQEVETLFQVKFLTMPFVMVFTSTIIGDIKERDKKKILSLEQVTVEKDKSLKVQIDKNDILLKQERDLRRQLVTKLETTDSLYYLAQKFSTIDLAELYHSTIEIITDQINAESVAIYKIKKDDTKLQLKKASSKVGRKFEQEIFIDENTNVLIQRTIEIGKVSTIQNINNRESFTNYTKDDPLLVGPIWNGEDIYGVVVVYDIPFLEYVPHNFRLFKLLCNWFSQSLFSIFRFNALSRNTIMDDRFSVYKFSYFLDRLIAEAESLRSEEDKISILKFILKGFDQIPNDKKIPVKQTVCKIIDNQFNPNECVSTGQEYGEIFVMLPGKDEEESQKRIVEVMAEIKILSAKSLDDFYHLESSSYTFSGVDARQDVLNIFKKEINDD